MDKFSGSENFDVAKRRLRVLLERAQLRLSVLLYFVDGRVAMIQHNSWRHIPEDYPEQLSAIGF